VPPGSGFPSPYVVIVFFVLIDLRFEGVVLLILVEWTVVEAGLLKAENIDFLLVKLVGPTIN